MGSLRIAFLDPWVYAADGDREKRPLSAVTTRGSHIHATLSIVVDGRPLPMLGYWGPDDACLGHWAAELGRAVKTLSAPGAGRYVYDEGEQGQPAFVFECQGAELRVSIGDSELGDGMGIPEWGVQTCDFGDFVEQVERFIDALESAIEAAASGAAKVWLKANRIAP